MSSERPPTPPTPDPPEPHDEEKAQARRESAVEMFDGDMQQAFRFLALPIREQRRVILGQIPEMKEPLEDEEVEMEAMLNLASRRARVDPDMLQAQQRRLMRSLGGAQNELRGRLSWLSLPDEVVSHLRALRTNQRRMESLEEEDALTEELEDAEDNARLVLAAFNDFQEGDQVTDDIRRLATQTGMSIRMGLELPQQEQKEESKESKEDDDDEDIVDMTVPEEDSDMTVPEEDSPPPPTSPVLISSSTSRRRPVSNRGRRQMARRGRRFDPIAARARDARQVPQASRITFLENWYSNNPSALTPQFRNAFLGAYIPLGTELWQALRRVWIETHGETPEDDEEEEEEEEEEEQ